MTKHREKKLREKNHHHRNEDTIDYIFKGHSKMKQNEGKRV